MACLPRASALSLAKQRASHRRRSAGAAIFVVSMTLAVLVSVGVYALAAAANETRTAGNERQSTQTHYLADYGIVGTAHELSSTRAQLFLNQMMSTYRDTSCVSLPAPPTAYQAYPQMIACRRMGSAELGSTWAAGQITTAYGSTTPFAASVNPGSLGPVPMTADFFVELTEPMLVNAPARYALDLQFCFIEMTVTSTGLTYPTLPSAPTGQFGAEGTETERARLIAGPVRCPR